MTAVLVGGLGKLGSVLAAVLADAGHHVVGVDPNRRTVNAINDGKPPVDEPGLDKLIAGLDAGQLVAVETYAEAVHRTDIAMIVVPTPSLPSGGFDASIVIDAVTAIGKELASDPRSTPYTVVVCSTLMPGTMDDKVVPALEAASGMTVGEGVLLAHSPEFIALGTVIADMTSPDMVLIGSRDRRSAESVAALSAEFRAGAPVRTMSFVEAELTKISVNSYLSAKIGFANMIGAAAVKMQADPRVVLAAVGADNRIGSAFLKKGSPPGGPCLPRDLVALEALGKQLGTPMPMATAARQAARDVVDLIVEQAGFGGSHPRPDVAILGVAYKPGSPVTDDSLGLSLIARAAMAGIRPLVHDPVASIPDDFVWNSYRWCATAETAIAGAGTVIIACPHVEYEGLDLGDRTVINPWA